MNTRRRFPARGIGVVLLCVMAWGLAGCDLFKPHWRPRRSHVKVPPPIEHWRADDIVQTVGTSLSSDNGGWYLLIRTLADSLSKAAPNPESGGAPHGRNTFTVSGGAGPVVYDVDVGYIQGDSTMSSTRDTSSTDLILRAACTGGPFVIANGVQGTYWFATRDSSIAVNHLQPRRGDTLEFSGFFEDSTFALVHSTITPNTGRLWFHKNFVDFTLDIPRSNLKTNPYPIAGSELRLNVEAFALNSEAHSDWAFDHFLEVTFQFDGTATAIVRIGDMFPDPSWSYTYTMNLRTGHIERR